MTNNKPKTSRIVRARKMEEPSDLKEKKKKEVRAEHDIGPLVEVIIRDVASKDNVERLEEVRDRKRYQPHKSEFSRKSTRLLQNRLAQQRRRERLASAVATSVAGAQGDSSSALRVPDRVVTDDAPAEMDIDYLKTHPIEPLFGLASMSHDNHGTFSIYTYAVIRDNSNLII